MEKRNFPNAVYGTTKAALNYISRKIHFENEKLVVLAIDPGWVRTEMVSRRFPHLVALCFELWQWRCPVLLS